MKIEISKVEVSNRYRKDFGNVQELADSIKEQGLLQPIGITKEHQLVFGQRRIEAHKLLGLKEIDARIVDVTSIIEGEQVENEVRKDFTKTERLAIAENINQLKHGGNRKFQVDLSPLEINAEEASKKAGFNSYKEKQRVKNVVDNGIPELIEAMDEDLVDVTNASILSKKTPEKQKEVLAKVKSGKVKTIPEAEKEIKQEERKKKIEEQRKNIENGNIKKPEGKYDVIAIDPPWQYGDKFDPEQRRGTTPYPTMTLEEIKKLDIPANDDSVMFLWTTHSQIFNAKELLDEWGFEYKATMVWNKVNIATGKRFRYVCEFCLVGVRGKPFWDNTRHPELITEKRREHSRKPEAFYELVEKITAGKRLDYFSREKREGWDTFGTDEFKGE